MRRLRSASVIVVAIVCLALSWNPALAKGKGTAIQDGVLVYQVGHYLAGRPLKVGFDSYGYNYQAHMFAGFYANVYLGRDGFPPYDGDEDAYLASNPTAAGKWYWPYHDDRLVMKWNDAWLSNMDRDDDGLLDRHYGFPSYIGSGAWETNHTTWVEDGTQYIYFCKIVAAPQDAVKYPSSAIPGYTHVWRTPEGKEIGPDIWGQFAVILETQSGSGVLYRSPAGPGFGKW